MLFRTNRVDDSLAISLARSVVRSFIRSLLIRISAHDPVHACHAVMVVMVVMVMVVVMMMIMTMQLQRVQHVLIPVQRRGHDEPHWTARASAGGGPHEAGVRVLQGRHPDADHNVIPPSRYGRCAVLAPL